MKKISLIAAAALLSAGLIAFAAKSGNGNNPTDCGKKSCTTAVCEKSLCDTTACKVNCSPQACRPCK